jgi:hypothetical protein
MVLVSMRGDTGYKGELSVCDALKRAQISFLWCQLSRLIGVRQLS